jgi:transcriptional regulator with XRE-family HTH domain
MSPAVDQALLVAFGLAVRRQRVRRQRSVRQLATAAGLSEQQLARIEAGRCDVRYEQLLDLARSLDLTPAELVRGL